MSVIREKITIQELRHRGLSITPGSKYIPKSWLPKRAPSLQEIHRRLTKIKGDVASEICRIREEAG